jgi:transposase
MTCYVGLDVSLTETSVCVLEEDGRVRFEGRVSSRSDALVQSLRDRAPDAVRIGMETGQTAAVLFRAVEAAGLPILCLETRHAHRVLSARPNKTDRNDARGLAEMMRAGWYRAAWIRGTTATYVRSLLQGRRLLVQTRRTIQNTLRGGVKRFGLIMFSTAGRTFEQRAISALDRDTNYVAFAGPLLAVLKSIAEHIRSYDRQLHAISRADEAAVRLMTVPGVGYLTALAFVSTIEKPERFCRSTDVGAYLGLTPRVHQSGEVERMGRITKTGDNLTRSYLVEAANVLLTRIKRECPLREWGLRIVQRAGLKKAQVAVARKLAAMLHAIWADGTEFRWRSDMV